MRIAALFHLLAPVLVLVSSTPVFAAEQVTDLYESRVDVLDKSAKLRREAFGSALLKVVIKVSGSRRAAARPVIVEAIETPDRYVQQFRYDSVDAPADAAADAAEAAPALRLWVQFDPPAVDALMRDAGLPVWGRVRPSVLVLVAIEAGGARQLLSSDDPQGWARFMQLAAGDRAVPLVLPLMDLEDRATLRASDVWAGFEDNLQRASERYQSEGVLLGRVYEVAPNYWEARWRLLLEDTRSEWLEQGEGLDAVLLAGVHESADRLASRYGGFVGTATASGVAIKVTGIRTLGDYARALEYLDSLDEVSRVDVTRVEDGSVSFRVDARGGRETVRQVIALGRTLAEEGQPDLTEGLNYRLLP
jgi:hypothetical protein